MAETHAVTKVSQLTEATALGEDDLLYLSEDDGEGGFVSKYVKRSVLEDLFIRKVDVFINGNLGVLIIRK